MMDSLRAPGLQISENVLVSLLPLHHADTLGMGRTQNEGKTSTII